MCSCFDDRKYIHRHVYVRERRSYPVCTGPRCSGQSEGLPVALHPPRYQRTRKGAYVIIDKGLTTLEITTRSNADANAQSRAANGVAEAWTCGSSFRGESMVSSPGCGAQRVLVRHIARCGSLHSRRLTAIATRRSWRSCSSGGREGHLAARSPWIRRR